MEGAGRGCPFAVAKPVTREVLARVVGRDCALELLIDDLMEDLRGRPIQLVSGRVFTPDTRPAFGPAIRVAFDIPAEAKALTKLEAGVLMAIAMFQPVTRGDISEMFGREISRDLIAGLREQGLIAAGPRSPKVGRPTPSSRPRNSCSSSGWSCCATCRIWTNSRTRDFSAGRAGMGPDEQGSSWEARRTKLLPTLEAYLVLGSKRTSSKKMRLEPVSAARPSQLFGGS